MSPVHVPVEVGSDEWLAERRKGIGASEIAGVIGIAPDSWTSPFNLYWQKKGMVVDDRDDEAMQWGHDLEGVILNRFRREHPELLVETGGLYRKADREWQMATPDGLAYDLATGEPSEVVVPVDARGEPNDWPYLRVHPRAVVQVKTAGSYEHWGEEGTDDIPAYYLAQVRWEMDVMGCSLAYVPVLFHGRTYREYVVEQDTNDVALMVKEGAAFMQRLIEDDPPDVDWRTSTTYALKQLHPSLHDEPTPVDAGLINAWRTADHDVAEAKKRKREAENRIRAAMGDYAYAVVGETRVATRSIFPVKGYWREPTENDRLTVTKAKKEKAT